MQSGPILIANLADPGGNHSLIAEASFAPVTCRDPNLGLCRARQRDAWECDWSCGRFKVFISESVVDRGLFSSEIPDWPVSPTERCHASLYLWWR